MRTFIHKPRPTQKSTSEIICRTNQNIPEQRCKADSASNEASTRFAFNFSQTPVLSSSPIQIQEKLLVSNPKDQYEQEADQIADKIIQTPELCLQSDYDGRFQKRPQMKNTNNRFHNKYGALNTTRPPATYVTTNELLNSSGQALNTTVRSFMERRFSTDFGNVRTHTDTPASEMSHLLNARAFTYKNHIYYGKGNTPANDRLTAHELTHVLQQTHAATNVIRRTADQEDPGRYKTIYENLFVRAPSGGALKKWVEPSSKASGTAKTIINQFTSRLNALIAANPLAVGGTVPTKTTESAAESDAITIDKMIRNHFPQITTQLSAAQIRSAIGILSSSQTSTQDFLLQWLTNRLSMWTDIDDYNIREKDPRFQKMLKSLLSNSSTGPNIRILANRQAAFIETSGATRNIFIHRGASASLRQLILIHELTHFYAHQGFKDWVETTNAPRLYREGFTEFLARQVMTPAQRQGRRNYANHLQKVENQVARYVSVDDIANAYFRGQVWRLEGRSAIARKLFESQVGLREGAARNTERSQSQTSTGIVQTVTPGSHYRFMNLGVGQSQPKAEHVALFQNIYKHYIQGHVDVRIRFVGYASSPGSTSLNLQLSKERSQAFYQMARNAGIPSSQLIDENNPPHQGESSPTAENANVHGRAFNRRVELFIMKKVTN